MNEPKYAIFKQKIKINKFWGGGIAPFPDPTPNTLLHPPKPYPTHFCHNPIYLSAPLAVVEEPHDALFYRTMESRLLAVVSLAVAYLPKE